MTTFIGKAVWGTIWILAIIIITPFALLDFLFVTLFGRRGGHF